MVAEHLRQRQSILFDETRPSHAFEDTAIRNAEGHATGQQAVATGRADRGGRVGIGESHSFACQPVDVGRGDSGFCVVAADIAIAEIVGEDDHDVRGGIGGVDCGQRSQQQSCEEPKRFVDEHH